MGIDKRAVIIGASLVRPEIERRYLERRELVICADGGLFNAEALGLSPHMLIGDGDSGGFTPPVGCAHILLPGEKDDTDLKVCVDAALERGYTDILLLGCSGGRLDHYLAALGMLEYLYVRSARGMLVGEGNEVVYRTGGGRLNIRRDANYKYLSIMPADERLEGVTLEGLKYPLRDVVVYRHTPLCVSNEFADDEAVIEIKRGSCYIIRSN